MTTRKKKAPLTFVQQMQKFIHANIADSVSPNEARGETWDSIPELEDRIREILKITNNINRSATNMLFFVMYDIESNKVRNLIVKYLIKKGCTRVQRSIFLADLETTEYESIRKDLAEVQAAYENHDSILIVPISTDYLHAMKIIGQTIDLDLITHNKNTMFF